MNKKEKQRRIRERHRREEFQRRSRAAKLGWQRRRQSKPGPPKQEPIEVTRMKYQKRRGKDTIDLEVHRQGQKIIKVIVGSGFRTKTYTKPDDVDTFLALIARSTPEVS